MNSGLVYDKVYEVVLRIGLRTSSRYSLEDEQAWSTELEDREDSSASLNMPKSGRTSAWKATPFHFALQAGRSVVSAANK